MFDIIKTMFNKIFQYTNNSKASKFILLAIFALIFLLKLFSVLTFNNSDWEPDSYMHFLELRTIFTDFPNNLSMGLGVWTKPLFAYPYSFIVEIFGGESFLYVQILNIIVGILTSFMVYRILRKFKINFWLATSSIFLVNFSFLFFRSSVSALTEPIFTLFIVLGFYLLITDRIKASTLFIGLSFLARTEGVFFVGIWAFILILKELPIREKLINFIILILPALIWNLLGAIWTGNLLFLIKSGYPSTPGIYGYGGWLTYLDTLLRIDLMLLLFLLIGVIPIANFFENRRLNIRYLPIGIALIFIAIQTILYKFGLFGTAGITRYLVVLVPFIIISLILSLDLMLNKVRLRYQILFLFVIIVMQFYATFTIFTKGALTGEPTYPIFEKEMFQAGKWIEDNVPKDKFVFSDRPEILFYANLDLNNSSLGIPDLNLKNPGIYVLTREWGKSVYKLEPNDFSEYSLLKQFDEEVWIFTTL